MDLSLNDFKKSYNLMKDCDFIHKTRLERNDRLSEKYDCNVYFKREDLQSVRSFKIRGAYNKILKNNRGQRFLTVSAGNHAQGFSLVCNKLKLKHYVCLPENTPLQKINRIKYFGKEYLTLHLVGKNLDETFVEAKIFCEQNDYTFIHPFDDIDIIVGQGTISLEIYEDVKPDVIICSIGGGGLISGVGTCSKLINSNCLIYGVEPENANSMKLSLQNLKVMRKY